MFIRRSRASSSSMPTAASSSGGHAAEQQWLPDTPETRNAVKHALRRYDVYSNSNPVPGIFRALRTLYDPNNEKMKMGIYIFGDEFTGTADAVVKRLDELNPTDKDGKRKVVINAIGFPDDDPRSGFRWATPA